MKQTNVTSILLPYRSVSPREGPWLPWWVHQDWAWIALIIVNAPPAQRVVCTLIIHHICPGWVRYRTKFGSVSSYAPVACATTLKWVPLWCDTALNRPSATSVVSRPTALKWEPNCTYISSYSNPRINPHWKIMLGVHIGRGWELRTPLWLHFDPRRVAGGRTRGRGRRRLVSSIRVIRVNIARKNCEYAFLPTLWTTHICFLIRFPS